MTRTKAILVTAVNTVTVDDIDLPAPGVGEVLIEAAYSLISPGTELRCISGKQPGTLPFPFIPGYSLAGTVIACGAETQTPVGTRVFCGGTIRASASIMWGGHVGHAIQSEAGIYPIPDGLDFRDAVAAKLTAITYHGLRLSQPRPDEWVAVIGLGVIGQLSARLHALSGARVIGIDLLPERMETARRARIETLDNPGSDIAAAFKAQFGRGADVVVDTTGVPSVIDTAIALARTYPWNDMTTNGARIVVQGSYPDMFCIPYQAAFEKELTFLIPRDTQPRDIRAALELISRNKLGIHDLISRVYTPDAESVSEAYRTLRDDAAHTLTAAFDWRKTQ